MRNITWLGWQRIPTVWDYDEALDKIIASAQKFNVDRVKQEDIAKVGGGPPDEE